MTLETNARFAVCPNVIIESLKRIVSLFRLVSANNGACEEPIIIVILGFYRRTARPLRDHRINQRMMTQTERSFLSLQKCICFVPRYPHDRPVHIVFQQRTNGARLNSAPMRRGNTLIAECCGIFHVSVVAGTKNVSLSTARSS